MTNSDSMIEMLSSQLGAGGIDQIASQLGLGRDQTTKAVSAALPMLFGGVMRNAETPDGAASLLGALQRDHDGSVLDNIGDFLGQGSGAANAGMGILKHVFGGRESNVGNALAGSSGVNAGQMQQILAMLAPLVLGMLGKNQRQQGLDIGGLTDLLGGERKVAEKKAPGAVDLVSSLLDSDGDGSVTDDLAKLGGGLLGSFFGGK